MSSNATVNGRRWIGILALVLGVTTAAQAQPTFTKAFNPSTIGPGSVSMLTFTITNDGGTPVTELAFTDVLPVGVTIADPASASTTCPGGVVDAPAGGDTITFTDGGLGGNSVCTVMVNVIGVLTGDPPNTYTNVSGDLTSDAGNSGPATADLTVTNALPGFTKSFAPSSIPLGDRSTLTFTIDNTLNPSPAVLLAFTDNLPVGMEVANPANASNTCTGGALTATPGSSVISYSAGLVSANSACTLTVDVMATAAGMLDNVTGELTSGSPTTISSGKASATLDVTVTPIALTKLFTDDPVPPGGTATLEFTITNRDRDFSATNIAFTDDLGAALSGLVATGLPFAACGGTVAGIPDAGTIDFSGGTLGPGGSCTITVSLSVPVGATPGSYMNTTSAITATVDGSPVVGNMASDDLFIQPVPLLTKTFLSDPVDAGAVVTVEFTITNTSSTSAATDIAFTDNLDAFLSGTTASALPSLGFCGAGSIIVPIAISGELYLNMLGGQLAADDFCTFTVDLQLPEGTPGNTYTNTTSAISATVDGEALVGSPASDDLTVIAVPHLGKSFTDDPVPPGGTVTLEFTLTHSENAPTDATDITFTDDLTAALPGLTANLPPSPDPPCGAGSSLTGSLGDTFLTLMGGSLMPGEECTFSVTLDVPAGAAPGSYPNTTSDVSATVMGLAATSQPATDDLEVAGLIFTKEFVDDPVIPGATVILRFTIENVHPTDDATITSFTDDLSATLSGLAATGGPSVNTCGGTLSGTSTLTYVGGSVMNGETCTIEVELLVPGGAADGTYGNITGPLATSLGNINPATDHLTVDSNRLQLTKEFTDDPVTPGGTVNLRFTLTNLGADDAVSDIAFTDDLGAALAGLAATGLPLAACGGTVSGTSTISFSGGSLAGGEECFFDVAVDVPGGAAAGTYPNTTSDVTGTIIDFPVSGTAASDDLVVIDFISFSKSFDGPTTAPGTAVLTFTLINSTTDPLNGLSFTDNLDDVLSGLVATNLPLSNPCGAGSSLSGTSLLTFMGGSLGANGGTCTFDVEVQVPAAATAGTFPNTTSDLFASGLPVAEPATADLVVEPPPTFAKSFDPASIGTGLVSTLTFTIDNSASALAASSLAFTDNLPAGVEVATPPNASTTCTGGTVTATAGTGVISYSGGTVGAGASCTLDVDVTGTGTGAHVNTTGDLTSSSGNSGTAAATLTVNPQPGFSKSFAPDPILTGGTSTLTFTIDNTGSTVDATGLDFTDNLPAAVVVASTANATTTCTGGTLTAASGTGVISYSGGTVGAGASCTLDVDVTSTTAGTHVNTTGDLTSSLGNSGTATDTLTVNPPPTFAKSFDPDPIIIGNVSTLTFTIDNTASTVDATGLDFTDNLPADLLVASPSNATTDCTGGTVTATADTGVVAYTGGTVGAGASCTLSVDVTSDTPGVYDNTTGDLTSSSGNSGPANDTLEVLGIPDVSATKDDVLIDINSIPQPGDILEYAVVITNSGNGAAMGVLFNDTVDPNTGLDCTTNPPTTTQGAVTTCEASTGEVAVDVGDIAAFGGTATITFQVVIANPVDGGIDEVSNQGLVSGSNFADMLTDDPDNPGGPGEENPTITTVEAGPDVAATLDDALVVDNDGDGKADPGDTIEYTAVISNTGDEGALSVLFTDVPGANTTLVCGSVVAPDGVINVGNTCPADTFVEVDLDMVSGDPRAPVGKQFVQATVTFRVTIDSPLPIGVASVETQGTVDFTADGIPQQVPTDDPATGAPFDPTVTPIDREADFALTKTVDNPTPGYLSNVVFTLTLTNLGPAPGAAEVTDVLPPGLTFVSADPASAYEAASGTWTTGTVDVGDSRVLTITTRVETVDPVTNTAAITDATFPDPDESNNSDTASITPIAADLAIVKTLLAFSGDSETNIITATFKLTVTNNGPSDATGVIVEDPLPEGATLNPVPAGYNPATGLWTIGDLADGASAMLVVVLTADGNNDLVNIAVVSGDQPDQDESNNVAGSQAQHDRRNPNLFVADLSLTKTVDNEMPAVGDTITYTITLTNDGPSATAGVAVFDGFPDDSLLTFLSATTSTASSSSSCCFDDSLWVWSAGAVPRGATKTLEIKAVVVGTGEITNTAEIIQSYLPDPDSYFGNGDPNDDDQDSATIVVSPAALSRGQTEVQANLAEVSEAQASLAEVSEAPTEFALGSNYPNPFNPETVIPYAVAEASHVRIVVYDVLGREVALLLDGERSVGRYAVRWRADNLPTGMYIVRMQAGAVVKVRQVVLLK